ncbi:MULTISPECIES: aromatic ring-hydroxylating oxygenase subunit alpha [unclassified Sphingomonas]|uniref:aromatic ring-hydroxylating oxygenase subunit alpha n=1 Tax=unclassified Sphingomonas TaxID=196159 RepID=UPI0006F5AB99|nr:MULTISPECIES: Rieske 2Fe-2S domain-containing protein [unclassified Sphingomonas]KQX18676.1 Rieske (2Fe-2S) protein [Sphingomonas sp. Root1294]KQY72001.1 Rieske (2Fe-2S) protein [Sphingomonas sp. Root50]KRB94732.1 Rieske (2Fe-2S) protein [Sphingomonas sp. Root720]
MSSSTDFATLVRDDRVLTPMYTDAAIFEEEMDRIFKNTWVWVAHASDVPTGNTFKTSYVGRERVIVTRDKQGQIHTLLNRCRHRAATVCEKRKGKASVFVCPYHGWSYDVDGKLRKVPHIAGYGEGLDTDELGLVSLRTEEYNGMIFATYRDDIEPLVDFLGPAKKWIDLFMKQGGGYGVKTLGEHRFRFPGNWKIQLENTTDAYHFPIVHKTFLDSLDAEAENVFDVLGQGGWVEDLGNGHSVMVMIPDLIDLEDNLDAPIPQRFEELAAELAAEGMPDDQVRRVVRAVGGSGFNLNMFPNIACSMAFFRVLRPVSVDETEITHVAIGMDGGPVPANRMRLRLHEHFQGPMGFGTPDDAEGWERVQRGANAGEDLWIMVNRGVDAPAGVAAPGHNAGDVSAETGMRAAYQMWKRMMTA